MATWISDAMHSEAQFKVKHLMVSTVTGHFEQFNASMEADKEDFTDATIQFEADINSINTKNEQRDQHLKSDDFFNAEQYPKMIFNSNNLEKVSDSDYKLHGNLTIRDVTLPVVLDVEYGGVTNDAYGRTIAGFELSGKIKRKDFGLKWHATTEAGGVVVSDEVKILANIEMVKQ